VLPWFQNQQVPIMLSADFDDFKIGVTDAKVFPHSASKLFLRHSDKEFGGLLVQSSSTPRVPPSTSGGEYDSFHDVQQDELCVEGLAKLMASKSVPDCLEIHGELILLS